MPEPALAATAAQPAPTSAVQAAQRRWRLRTRRSLLVLPAICLGIAAILTAIDGHGFGYKMLYSLCIGAICMTTVDLTRLAFAWLSDRIRSARSLPFVLDEAALGWRGVIPGAILSMVIGPPLGMQLGDWITGFHTPSMLNLDSNSTRITLAFSVVATVVSVVVLSTAERLSHARAQAQAAQRLAAENQLRLLQSQLEPHMLFNTLANLRVLITMDPARAQAMLDHLIAFLRATLNASRNTLHPLSAEFAHLADYLALMAVRMGPRLTVQLKLPDDLASAPVPPLLLQPLVENSIKHGLEPQVDGGRIEVTARQVGGRLQLDVRDTGAGLGATPASAGTAFGLEQVRARLATLYGPRATFTLQAAADAEGGTLARIDMPLA
jgi:signal transduction histidine kinase